MEDFKNNIMPIEIILTGVGLILIVEVIRAIVGK